MESANVRTRPTGVGIEKSIQSGCRCGEVGLLRQKDPHVFNDELRHGADAEDADFFGFDVNASANNLERLRAVGGDLDWYREAFDLEIAIDAHAHKIRLGGVGDRRQEEKKEEKFNHKREWGQVRQKQRRSGLDF